MTLPLALLHKFESDWLVPLFTMLVAYPVLAMDLIGPELQNPFSVRNLGHLPLDDICRTIEENLLGLLAEEPEAEEEAADDREGPWRGEAEPGHGESLVSGRKPPAGVVETRDGAALYHDRNGRNNREGDSLNTRAHHQLRPDQLQRQPAASALNDGAAPEVLRGMVEAGRVSCGRRGRHRMWGTQNAYEGSQATIVGHHPVSSRQRIRIS